MVIQDLIDLCTLGAVVKFIAEADMIEGTFEIRWVNSNWPTDARRYWVNFFPYGGRFQRGAVPHLEFVGEESLLDYLIGIQVATMTVERRTERAREWLLEIRSAGHLSLHNAIFSEEQYKVFRPAC